MLFLSLYVPLHYSLFTLTLNHCLLWQGEAKSAELIGQAIANNPAFLALRQIEAAREISHTIAASSNKVFLDSRDLLLGLQQLNVGGKQKKWSDRPAQSHTTVEESSLRYRMVSVDGFICRWTKSPHVTVNLFLLYLAFFCGNHWKEGQCDDLLVRCCVSFCVLPYVSFCKHICIIGCMFHSGRHICTLHQVRDMNP